MQISYNARQYLSLSFTHIPWGGRWGDASVAQIPNRTFTSSAYVKLFATASKINEESEQHTDYHISSQTLTTLDLQYENLDETAAKHLADALRINQVS
jgi:hypothetical protein